MIKMTKKTLKAKKVMYFSSNWKTDMIFRRYDFYSLIHFFIDQAQP